MPKLDLRKFCAKKDATRCVLTLPWVSGGYQYATDDRICVRVPAPGKPDAKVPKRRAKAGQKWPATERLLKWRRRGPWVPWPHKDDGPLVGNHHVQECYYAMIAALPAAEYLLNDTPDNAPMPFRFDGGEGLVMGMIDPIRIIMAGLNAEGGGA